MSKKYLILLLFLVYVILLFAMAIRFDDRDQQLASGRFLSGLAESVSLLFRYIAFSIMTSSAFLFCVNYFKKGPLSYILLAPLFFIGVAFVIGLIISFFLWISRLEDDVNIYQKMFLISTTSTTVITIWLIGDKTRLKKESS